MAWLEHDRPKGPFQIVFRYGNKRVKRSSRTRDEQEATELAMRIDRRLRLISKGDLTVPDNADPIAYLMSDVTSPSPRQLPPLVTLGEVFTEFFEALPPGGMEENSRRTAQTHRKHLERFLGKRRSLRDITQRTLQEYINHRAKQPGRRGKLISAVTIRKELSTLSSVWSFARTRELVSHAFPNTGLRYAKVAEKPRFQTRVEIERQIGGSDPTADESAELWECLFLTLPDLEEFLKVVQECARHAFLYPMILLAADTGARRSELLRSERRDIDIANNTVTFRERKRSRGRHTTRRVPLTERANAAMQEWLADHPGGPHTFCISPGLGGGVPQALSVNQADDHFDRTLEGTRWSVVRGWHVLRHSFASNCLESPCLLPDDVPAKNCSEQNHRASKQLQIDLQAANSSLQFG